MIILGRYPIGRVMECQCCAEAEMGLIYHKIHQFLRLVDCVYCLMCFLDLALFLSFVVLSSGELYCRDDQPQDEDDAETDEDFLEERGDRSLLEEGYEAAGVFDLNTEVFGT